MTLLSLPELTKSSANLGHPSPPSIHHTYKGSTIRELSCPLVFCKQNDFTDYHAHMCVYSIDNCMYIVPKYNIDY